MTRFNLTFDYPDRLGAKAIAQHVVTADTLEDAAEYAASQRGISFIHVRVCNGEEISRPFTFCPSEKVA